MFSLGLISAEAALCRVIGEQLEALGTWQIASFPTAPAALEAWGETFPSLILWDAADQAFESPENEAFLRQLDSVSSNPLLLLFAEEEKDRPGVTESFKRPVRLGFLLSRLSFYGRVLQQTPDMTIDLGSWQFLTRARKVRPRHGGMPLSLTDKESRLLFALCQAGETPCARESLLAEIWGYDSRVDTHTLETHIYRLRRKLMADDPKAPDLFLSEAGGYRLNPAWRTNE